MAASDESWAKVARSSRDALALVGHPIGPRCMPDEAEPCGATFAMHAMANFAVLKAIADHQLTHLGARYIEAHAEIYMDQRAELERICRLPHPAGEARV